MSVLLAVSVAAAALVTLRGGAPSLSDPSCLLDEPLHRVAAASGQQLITLSKNEAANAVDRLKYSTQSSSWQAASQPGAGLAAVHRLYNPGSHDILYSTSSSEISNAVTQYGYVDDGTVFYASVAGDEANDCANALVYAAVGPDRVRHYSDDPSDFGASFGTPSPQFWVHDAGKSHILAAAPYFYNGTAAWRAYQSATGDVRRDYYNIGATPISIWLSGNATDAENVERVTMAANASKTVPQFVLYAIPGRDCGGFSRGGVADIGTYEQWIDTISRGIGDREAIVILEPDAISFCDNNAQTRALRTEAMTYAAQTLHDDNPGVYTYLHAGSGTLDLDYARDALIDSGIRYMRGFAMNVASHGPTQTEEAYGDDLVAALSAAGYPDKRYVVDTSRNGVGRASNPGASYNSCNNHGAALGARPTSDTDDRLADAYLWIKPPGESDGSGCHGPTSPEPNAGAWFPQLAHDLFDNAVDAGTIADWQIGESPYTDQT